MAKLRLALLGGFEARSDSGLSLAISRKKAQMLLAYLAMHPTQTHLRDKLATLLWGDAPAEQARLSLRQTLFIIRQALPADPMLLDGDSVAVAAEGMTVDVSEFEQLARSGDPDDLERAPALYQGDLLEGIRAGSAQFEEWLLAERERLHELALEAFAKLLGHQMKLGATEPAIQTALRLLSLDPLQEVTHRALMQLYAGQGRRAAALRQYQLCVDVLQRELGVEPEEATKQVYRELLPQPSPRLAPQADPHPMLQPRRRRLRAPRRARSVTPPLIGRDAEVDRLTQALAKACAGHGQAVALLGEAGIGKTRLITALQEATARRGAQALIGRAYETERLLAFGPWVQAIREAGIIEGRALEGLGAGWIADLSYVFPELRQPEWPLPSEPIEALRLFDAITELVKSLATRRPLVLVLEDLHWADEMSVRLFAFLGRRLEGRRILLVGTAREEELDGSPVRRMLAELLQEERLVRLALAPLSLAHTRELVRSLSQGSRADESSLARLEDRVWTLSEGNPFVIVESLREKLDTARGPNLPDLSAVPAKVRELILGRLERLSEGGQHLLATAAVIGRDCEFQLLQRAADLEETDAASVVEALVRTHILHSVGERFDFTHDRLREVAYDRLLPIRRRLLHARVVAALEDIYGVPDPVGTVQQDRSSEHIEQLAYHTVAGEIWPQAVRYLRRAGMKAAERSANREARTHFEHALGVLEHLPESRDSVEQALDVRLELRRVLLALGDYARMSEHLREAEALAHALGDRRRLSLALIFLGACHYGIGDLRNALDCDRRALAVVADLDDFELQAVNISSLARDHYALGDYRQAGALFREGALGVGSNVSFGRFGLAALPAVFCRSGLARCLAQVGEFADGAVSAEEAIRIAEKADQSYSLVIACLGLGSLHLLKGDLSRATCVLERAVDLCRRWTIPRWLPTAAASLGYAYVLLGRLGEGVPILRDAIDQLDRTGIGFVDAPTLAWMSEAHLSEKRIDEAGSMAHREIDRSRLGGLRGHEAHGWRVLAEIAVSVDPVDVKSAEGYFHQALTHATELGMRPLVAHCHRGLGKLYGRTGMRHEAQEHLTTATTMYREMEMTYWLRKAEAELTEAE